MTPEVEDKDVTVRKADLSRDIRSFISYAVGCMFGRYSLYNEGLLYAGGSGGDFGSLVERIQDYLHENGNHVSRRKSFILMQITLSQFVMMNTSRMILLVCSWSL